MAVPKSPKSVVFLVPKSASQKLLMMRLVKECSLSLGLRNRTRKLCSSFITSWKWKRRDGSDVRGAPTFRINLCSYLFRPTRCSLLLDHIRDLLTFLSSLLSLSFLPRGIWEKIKKTIAFFFSLYDFENLVSISYTASCFPYAENPFKRRLFSNKIFDCFFPSSFSFFLNNY